MYNYFVEMLTKINEALVNADIKKAEVIFRREFAASPDFHLMKNVTSVMEFCDCIADTTMPQTIQEWILGWTMATYCGYDNEHKSNATVFKRATNMWWQILDTITSAMAVVLNYSCNGSV